MDGFVVEIGLGNVDGSPGASLFGLKAVLSGSFELSFWSASKTHFPRNIIIASWITITTIKTYCFVWRFFVFVLSYLLTCMLSTSTSDLVLEGGLVHS